MLKNILKKLTNKQSNNPPVPSKNERRLEKVIGIANKIRKENPAALKDYVQLLGRKLQSDYMCKCLTHLEAHKVPDLDARVVWFDESTQLDESGTDLYKIKNELHEEKVLTLASDLVLPWPWEMNRIVSNLSHIGLNRACGAWRQDSNHIVEYWKTFGIAWVHGGNHSIMTGIIRGEGQLAARKVYDLSGLFNLVKFNGNEFVRIDNNEVISTVEHFEFGCIFEIGRMIHKHNLNVF